VGLALAPALRESLYRLGYHMYVITHDRLVPLRPGEAEPGPQYNALFTVRDVLPGALGLAAPGTRDASPGAKLSGAADLR
jgi:hypothetical protein